MSLRDGGGYRGEESFCQDGVDLCRGGTEISGCF